MKPFRIQYVNARRDRLPPWVYNWWLYSGKVPLGSFPTPELAMDAIAGMIEDSLDCKALVSHRQIRDRCAIKLAASVLTIEEGCWWTPAYWQARLDKRRYLGMLDRADLVIREIKRRLNARYGEFNRDPS